MHFVNFWAGRDDTCFEALKRLHGNMSGSTLSEVPGDHAGAMMAWRKSLSAGSQSATGWRYRPYNRPAGPGPTRLKNRNLSGLRRA